jgi:hypothetical protein
MSQPITSPPTLQIDASAIIAQGLSDITREQQEQVVLHIASEMQQIMGNHKIGREVTGGILPPLCSQLWISEGRRFGGIEIDLRPSSLPAGITVSKIKKLEPEFITRTGVHVQRLNTSGLTYVIDFARRSNLMLPSEVALAFPDEMDEPFSFPLGRTRSGKDVWLSFRDTSHILVGGESRSGKSTWLNAMLAGMLPLNPPQTLNVAFVDGKGVEFLIWDGIPHQVADIATTAERAAIVLESLVREMNRRLTFFRHARVRSLSQYNDLAQAAGGEKLPLMLIVIDEMTNLMVQTPALAQTLTNHLVQLSSQGAALGLILAISTQNPKAEVINTLIRGNLSMRIAFRVAEPNHSRTILGASVKGRGAHQILRTQRGRFMVRYDGDLVEMQGFKVDDDMARSIADELRRSATIRARRLRLSRAPTPVSRDDSVDLVRYVGKAEPMPDGDLELEDIEWEVLRVAKDEMDGGLAINPHAYHPIFAQNLGGIKPDIQKRTGRNITETNPLSH